MSASNYNWVCFGCRTVVRYPKTSQQSPNCISCQEECFCLGYKVAVPKKDDVKAWANLQKDCRERSFAYSEQARENLVRRKHNIEREINRLEALGENKGRTPKINELKKELTN